MNFHFGAHYFSTKLASRIIGQPPSQFITFDRDIRGSDSSIMRVKNNERTKFFKFLVARSLNARSSKKEIRVILFTFQIDCKTPNNINNIVH